MVAGWNLAHSTDEASTPYKLDDASGKNNSLWTNVGGQGVGSSWVTLNGATCLYDPNDGSHGTYAGVLVNNNSSGYVTNSAMNWVSKTDHITYAVRFALKMNPIKDYIGIMQQGNLAQVRDVGGEYENADPESYPPVPTNVVGLYDYFSGSWTTTTTNAEVDTTTWHSLIWDIQTTGECKEWLITYDNVGGISSVTLELDNTITSSYDFACNYLTLGYSNGRDEIPVYYAGFYMFNPGLTENQIRNFPSPIESSIPNFSTVNYFKSYEQDILGFTFSPVNHFISFEDSTGINFSAVNHFQVH